MPRLVARAGFKVEDRATSFAMELRGLAVAVKLVRTALETVNQ